MIIVFLQINRNATTSEIDKNFFVHCTGTSHIKGKSNFPHLRGTNNAEGGTQTPSGGASVAGSMYSLNSAVNIEKPWRNQKKEKREKLRKKFVHLDQH